MASPIHPHPHANKERTLQTMRRIAELRIKALGLTCTVDEYIKRAQAHEAQKGKDNV